MKSDLTSKRILSVAGALVIVVLGVLSEGRVSNDPIALAYVSGLIACGIGMAALIGFGQTSTSGTKAVLTDSDLMSNRETAEKFDDAIVRVCTLLQTHSADGREFANRLEGASRRISELRPGHSIDEIVLTLVRDNKKMQEKVVTLSEKLNDSHSMIQSLQSNLLKSEQDNIKDSLTSVGNRRYFDERLVEEVCEARKKNHALCLVMIDLDHFKNINDKFGHVVGDEILRRFADLLVTHLKEGHKVARYGGEEFAVILPNTSVSNACVVFEQIRKELETKQWVLGQTGRRVGNVTASFGIATLNADENEESLVRRADAALYKAKAEGRNRIEIDYSNELTKRAPPAHGAPRAVAVP